MPTPAQLKTEIQAGPHAAALAPLITSGNDKAIADFLNDATGAGKGTITLSVLDKQAVLKEFFAASLIIAGKTAAIQGKWDRYLNLLQSLATITPADINDMLTLAVTDGLLTQLKVDALKARVGGRSEFLWGEKVTHLDVAQALRGA